jgi:hypothetical protein
VKPVISSRLKDNLARVTNLLTVYDGYRDTAQGRKSVYSLDILRAATVFLHATLEEFLRGLILWKWPAGSGDVLDHVPLIGHAVAGRPEKFLLGSLTPHKARLVRDVIDECIREYSNTVSFNSTADVTHVLTSVGVDAKRVEARFPDLAKLMERRHHIVHQADRNERAGPGHHKARSMAVGHVKAWQPVREFGESVLAEVSP